MTDTKNGTGRVRNGSQSRRDRNAARLFAAFTALLLLFGTLCAFPASAVDLLGVMTAETYENEAVCPGVVLPYRIYVPAELSVQAAEHGCGVLLFLHDEDCRGDDNVKPLSDSAKTALLSAVLNDAALNQSTVIVVPQCPSDRGWTSDGGVLLALVRDLLNTLGSEMKLDAQRFSLIGISDGATGGYTLLSAQTENGGPVFSTAFLAAGTCPDPDALEAYAKTKIFSVTSDNDPVTPPDSVDRFVEAADGQGIVTYSRYAGLGHEVWEHAFTDERMTGPFLSAFRPETGPQTEEVSPDGTETGEAEELPGSAENASDDESTLPGSGGAGENADAENDGLSGVHLPKIAGTEITAVMIAGVILIAACVIAAVILIAGLVRNNRDQL